MKRNPRHTDAQYYAIMLDVHDVVGDGAAVFREARQKETRAEEQKKRESGKRKKRERINKRKR